MKLNYLFTCLFAFTLFSINAQQKTLLNKDGERIRGTAIAIGKRPYVTASTSFCMDPNGWQQIKDRHLNAVRVCWIGGWYNRRGFNSTSDYWGIPDPSSPSTHDTHPLIVALDQSVANAVAKDMTIIINYHNTGEQSTVNYNGTTLLPESTQ
ncbi:hypothetical protein JM658_07710 [Joostella atrarenae]|uniref:Uncharacterized protein n=1 Tax=Joostella atrarenae TaxID=679257 RepID=A0ABS9J2R8_9FLAO|nr:hypothetical protein [Joostella atrarenae]MCF8714692.1 hypothetical protein [Joostella atrarenae]MCF8714712.1 hypothetical protein [Joostella atrarenae]